MSAHLRRARALLLALVVAFAACDDSEPTLYLPTYDPNAVTPIPEITLCPLMAQNVCATLRPCCAPSPFAFDETKCRAVVRAQCEAKRSSAHDGGELFDEQLAGRCAEGVTALVDTSCRAVDPSSDLRPWLVDHACRSYFHGRFAIGSACDKTESCVQVDGAPVLCTGPLQTCQQQVFLKGGDSCTSIDPSCNAGCVCGPGLNCSGEFSGRPTCTATRLPDGATCTVDFDCGNDRRCACTNGDTLCANKVCQALPGIGESCWPGADGKGHCVAGLRCDHDKDQCTDGKTIGQPCGADDECASGKCREICAPSGIVDPLTCSGVFDVSGPFGFLAQSGTTTGATP